MLLIDVGNSRVKAAYSTELNHRWAATYQDGDRQREIDRVLASCQRRPRQVVLSCVSDQQSADYIQHRSMDMWGVDVVRLVSSQRFGGLVNGYTEPSQLGIDRWSGLVAAWHQLRGAVIVVGCGTAITVDSVTAAGRHLGGVIFPGLRLAEESFYGATGVPRVRSADVRQVYAHDTASAVASGVRWAIAGGINELLKRLDVELGGAANIWITGGDAAELQTYIDADAELIEDLVYQGMVLLAEQ